MKKTFATGLLLSVVLVGCGAATDDRSRFIDASVEMACMGATMSMNELMSENAAGKMESVMKKHGFEDQAAMQKVGEQYAEDTDLQVTIAGKIQEKCGSSFAEMLK